MYAFGKRSKKHLQTIDVKLQEILLEAIKIIDFSIIDGHRSEEDQNKAFSEGKSKLRYPDSKHNSYPSQAVDIAPYPIDWDDLGRFAFLQGIIKGIAHEKGISVRLGIDWDSDGDIRDQDFMDYVHIELD